MARSITKSIDGREHGEAEAAALRAAHRRGLAPRLLAVERSRSGVRLTVERCGRSFPRRPGVGSVRQLARALARLHRARPPLAVRRLPGSLVPPSLTEGTRSLDACLARLARSPRFNARTRRAFADWGGAGRCLRRYLAPLDDEWSLPAVVLCHGDLKRENLRRDGATTKLIDFGSVCLAEPAWELAHCALALELSAELEDLLLTEYSLGRRGLARLGARMQGWRLLLAASVPLQWLEEIGGGCPPRLMRLLACSRTNLSHLSGRELPVLASVLNGVGTARP